MTLRFDFIGRKNQERDAENGMIRRKQTLQVKGFRPDTLDEKNRSVEVVMATEDPSLIFDPERWEIIEEVLLMAGADIPKEDKVPLTIDHWSWAEAVIGSVREMRIEQIQSDDYSGPGLVGRVFFSSDSDSEKYWTRVKEGHLDRFSVTYPASGRQSIYIAEGESSTVEGKTYDGPIVVTKQWAPKALGLVMYGADKNAKARTANHKSNKGAKTMNKKLRKWLERCGLSPEATEEEAYQYLNDLDFERLDPELLKDKPASAKKGGDGNDPSPNPNPEGSRKAVDPEDVSRRAIEAERQRVSEIGAMCKRFDIDEDVRDGLISRGVDVDKAREEILEKIAERRKAEPTSQGVGFRPSIAYGDDERDKFRAAAFDSLILRAGIAGMSVEKPAPGAEQLRGFTLQELARECLRVQGLDFSGRRIDMVGRAMTTDDFSYLLANVANKSLFAGWESAAETWQTWVATGSVSDFKTHYSPRLSEASDLDEIPEEAEYKYGKLQDAQETYSIATYGKLFAVSRQTIINDDLNALARIPAAHGEAAARKVGDVVYAVLTANGTMGDGVALFNAATHGNYVTSGSGAGPGIATIAAGILAMKTQKDIQELRRLNIRPEYFIAPAALEGTSEVFFSSDKFTDSDTVETDSSLAGARNNPYSGNRFTRVYEPRLDDNSETAWYLAGRKGKTVQVDFLDGIQAPYLEQKQGWTVDGTEFKVRIDAGAWAVDYRGLYCNEGT